MLIFITFNLYLEILIKRKEGNRHFIIYLNY